MNLIVVVKKFYFFLFNCSGASLYNLYDEDDEENSVTVPQETIHENNITMNKMKLLRSKMESLHTSKKVGYHVKQLLGGFQIQSFAFAKKHHCKFSIINKYIYHKFAAGKTFI